jgi:hypothetical protein
MVGSKILSLLQLALKSERGGQRDGDRRLLGIARDKIFYYVECRLQIRSI